MKRILLEDGYHYLNSPIDFAEQIRQCMGDESADLFLEVISNAEDAKNLLRELDIEPNVETTMDEYTLSEAVDLLSYATEW